MHTIMACACCQDLWFRNVKLNSSIYTRKGSGCLLDPWSSYPLSYPYGKDPTGWIPGCERICAGAGPALLGRSLVERAAFQWGVARSRSLPGTWDYWFGNIRVPRTGRLVGQTPCRGDRGESRWPNDAGIDRYRASGTCGFVGVGLEQQWSY